jgi:hypothetical protein
MSKTEHGPATEQAKPSNAEKTRTIGQRATKA